MAIHIVNFQEMSKYQKNNEKLCIVSKGLHILSKKITALKIMQLANCFISLVQKEGLEPSQL
jgi:hypothetical protein